jgi:hypothetical protein
MQKVVLLGLLILAQFSGFSSNGYWQQKADYKMDIVMDEDQHQYAGTQTLSYTNNSPDKLNRVFYHLYFNAFQPGSMMDVRSQTISDPDSRVGNRISLLTEDEIGYIRVKSLKMNGKAVSFQEVGTILEVDLAKAIAPGETVKFEMVWDAQVPLQIRRSGWMNAEGVEFSMTQWYPKMCEYDDEGWHSNPYVAREFHGVWGNFEVTIHMDEKYTIGGTGVLTNASEVGKGYAKLTKSNSKNGKLTWKFKAENVHDFAWAADPDFKHDMVKTASGVTMHFIYQDNSEFNQNWKDLQPFAEKGFDFLSSHFGQYPYPQYTVIQGGDGGMEYPMTTLISGNRNLRSLVGVTIHEASHSWYQGVLATNEALYEWMDEGFTSFATAECMARLFETGSDNPHRSAYSSYLSEAKNNSENALVTHADHYTTNRAYGVAAYSKGEVLLTQLGYVIGNDVRDNALLSYFDQWKFKHPDAKSFKRVMERESGLELDWYFEYFVNSTHTIDYGVKEISGGNTSTSVVLERIGLMPMPIDLEIETTDGNVMMINIPLEMMRGAKKQDENLKFVVEKDWPWTNPTYELKLDIPIDQILKITIDPKSEMADLNRANNSIEIKEGMRYMMQN